MTLPRWTPRWLTGLIGFLTNGEFSPGIQCCMCGTVIEIGDRATAEDEESLARHHYRYFHPETKFAGLK